MRDYNVYVGKVLSHDGASHLLTSSGRFELVGPAAELREWACREVALDAVPDGEGMLRVLAVHEMMDSRDLKTCARFLVERFGKQASCHVADRLEQAFAVRDAQAIAIWTALLNLV